MCHVRECVTKEAPPIHIGVPVKRPFSCARHVKVECIVHTHVTNVTQSICMPNHNSERYSPRASRSFLSRLNSLKKIICLFMAGRPLHNTRVRSVVPRYPLVLGTLPLPEDQDRDAHEKRDPPDCPQP